MSELDVCVDKYLAYKSQMDELNLKLLKYKKNIKTILKKQEKTEMETNHGYVSLKTATKSFVTKKNLPKDLWDKYSSSTKYETLTVRQKK